MSHCTMCRGTGSKRLRRRSRGRGYGGRRGPCPYCEGKGWREDCHVTLTFTIDELNLDVLKLLFNGSADEPETDQRSP